MLFDSYRILNCNQRLLRSLAFVINTNKQPRPTATGARRDFCLSRSACSNTGEKRDFYLHAQPQIPDNTFSTCTHKI